LTPPDISLFENNTLRLNGYGDPTTPDHYFIQGHLTSLTSNTLPSDGGETPPGGDVPVTPTDPTTGETPGTITFGGVTAGGTTTITSSQSGQPPPTGFKMGNPPTYYEISTTAEYSGSVQVCITYEDGDFRNEKNLRLMHNTDTNGDGVGDTWVDVTDEGYPDTVNNKVCGTTDSLSPFIVAEASITAPVDPVSVNKVAQASFHFHSNDPGIWGAELNWGDGSSSDTPVSYDIMTEIYEITDQHTYDLPGVYTVGLTIFLNGEQYGSDEYRYVVVYDPDGGFVTGGGWIQSPAGAYTVEPTLSGKGTFGFVSKYKKGANVPVGNTEFQFHAASFTFRSSDYDWLVIAGARAQFKGTGTINGNGDYGFLLTAIDGALPGGNGEDKFRIKIWDKATDDVVYDNQLGALDDVDPATVIGGGSIVIHKAK